MNSSSTQKPLDIAIIGGGIAGLTLAIGLLKRNIQVTVYESAHHFGEIGAGVAFGPNSTRAMALIDPSVKQGFDNCATSNQWESKQDTWFEFRYGQDEEGAAEPRTGKLFHRLSCPNGQATAHRAKFLDEMIKLIPGDIARFGKRLVSVKDLGDKGVHLKFRDGTEATHTAVIGCDGIKSETRKYVLGHDNPKAYAQWTGKYCHRGLAPMEKAVEAIGEELAMNNQMYLGRHGHILTFPVEKGETYNGKSTFHTRDVVEAVTLLLPAFSGNQSFTWSRWMTIMLITDEVVAFSSQESWNSDDWVVHSSKEDLFADYKGWGETVQKILGLMENTDVWALFDDPPAETYCKGRVCIIGDAAHASTPHQGSGAGMAIEDAYVLSSLLSQFEHAQQIEAAFKAYDTVRRERTQKLVATSREASHLWELELEGIEDDITKFKENVDRRMHWIWNEDLKAEVEHGKILMSEA